MLCIEDFERIIPNLVSISAEVTLNDSDYIDIFAFIITLHEGTFLPFVVRRARLIYCRQIFAFVVFMLS